MGRKRRRKEEKKKENEHKNLTKSEKCKR